MISLNFDGFAYLIESGQLLNGPLCQPGQTTQCPFVPYAAHERYRIQFTDNLDGTAAIAYFWLECDSSGNCTPHLIAEHDGPGVTYPLRVDASFREPGSTLENVTLVYIKGPKVNP